MANLTTKENNVLPQAIAVMIRSLQRFSDLLDHVLGSKDQIPSENLTTSPLTQERTPSVQSSRESLDQILTFTDIRTRDLLSMPFQAIHQQQPSYTAKASTNGQAQVSLLDLPTNLLIISCYVSLINLSREVLAAIRCSILGPSHQNHFTTLSSLEFNGLFLKQDSDLQVLILTQGIIRLLDRIGSSLVCAPVMVSKQDHEDIVWKRAITPHLLQSILKQKDKEGEAIDEENSFGRSIQGLREGIRNLHEVVYKTV
jgi:hypothetical protein